MYNFDLAKKRRKRRRIAIATIICTIGVISMSIIAFLGNQVGSFTVNLANEGVSLAIDEHSSFDKSTTYLHVSDIGAITGPHSYVWFETSEKYSFKQIHDENTQFKMGNSENENGVRFFKYTFFIKNTGSIHATYDMDVNLVENVKPNNSYGLDEYLRLMIFEGQGEDENRTVYARRSLTKYNVDQEIYKENICGAEGSGNYRGEAELFVDDTLLARRTNELDAGQMRMYTILFWLEGEDPECQLVPDKASLRLGVSINAHSN